MTSTRCSFTSFSALAEATASSVAPSSMWSSSLPAQQAALGVDVADHHPDDVRVRHPGRRQRAGLVGDHSHPDRCGARTWLSSHHVLLRITWCRPEATNSDASCDHGVRPCPPKHREVSPFLIRRFAWASSSPRWRWPRTTRSASRSSRSCDRACWRPGCAIRRATTTTCATTAYWVALLRYLGCTGHAHEVATVFGDEIAIRAQTLVHDAANPAEVMRDVMAYATAGHSPERARPDRQDDPGDRARVGGLQLLIGLRGGRHARAAARFRPRRARVAAVHVRALERQRLSQPRPGRGDSAADADRAPQPRHGGDRPPVLARSRPGGGS